MIYALELNSRLSSLGPGSGIPIRGFFLPTPRLHKGAHNGLKEPAEELPGTERFRRGEGHIHTDQDPRINSMRVNLPVRPTQPLP